MYSLRSVFGNGIPLYDDSYKTPKNPFAKKYIEIPEPLEDEELKEEFKKLKVNLEQEYEVLDQSEEPVQIKSVKQANLLIKRDVHNGLEIRQSTQGTSLYIDGQLFKSKDNTLPFAKLEQVKNKLEKIYKASPEGAAKQIIYGKFKKLEGMLKPKDTSPKPKAGRPAGSKNKVKMSASTAATETVSSKPKKARVIFPTAE